MELLLYLSMPFIVILLYILLSPSPAKKDETEAERIYQESIAISKYNLALLYEKQKRYEDALNLLTEAEQIFESHQFDGLQATPQVHHVREAKQRLTEK